MTTTIHIAYATLEAWADATPHTIAYAMPIETTAPGKDGFSTRELAVMVGQADEYSNLVHCVRIEVASLAFLNGSLFGDKAEAKQARRNLQTVWMLVQDWLAEQGYTVRKAMIAIPQDLRLVNGWADFLEWQPESKTYTRKPTPSSEGVNDVHKN